MLLDRFVVFQSALQSFRIELVASPCSYKCCCSIGPTDMKMNDGSQQNHDNSEKQAEEKPILLLVSLSYSKYISRSNKTVVKNEIWDTINKNWEEKAL